MEKPLVSVVLCTFNGASYLAEQVDSILAQTYAPLELIISDDASEDNTRHVLQRYENNPAVRILYQEKNIGLTQNYARAASESKGRFIAFSDQDDIWVKDKIEKLVNAIGSSPLVYSDSLLVDETGRSMRMRLSGLKRMYTGTDSRGYILYSCVWGHGMLITRDLLNDAYPCLRKFTMIYGLCSRPSCMEASNSSMRPSHYIASTAIPQAGRFLIKISKKPGTTAIWSIKKN